MLIYFWLPLRLSCSTKISDPDIMVGSFAETRHFTTPHHSLGPLDTLQGSLIVILSHTMGQAIRNHNRFAVDKYLPADAVARAAHRGLARISRSSLLPLPRRAERCPHPQVVDDKYIITVIIDWEWVSTQPRGLTFTPPCMLWPVTAFYDGSDALSDDERLYVKIWEDTGRHDLAKLVQGGRRWKRFCSS